MRARGINVVAALELGYSSVADHLHLAYAAGDGRSVVTMNGRDFIRHTYEAMERNERHAGVIAVPNTIKPHDVGLLIRAIEHFARLYPDGLDPYAVVWLAPAPADQSIE